MTEELFNQWLEALESGHYRQGVLELRDYKTNAFCAIGVLADLYDPTRWNVLEQSECGGYTNRYYFYGDTEDVLIDILPLPLQQKIVEWNDKQRLSFQEIAHLLRQEPPIGAELWKPD